MRILTILSIIICFLLGNTVKAQISSGGQPYSFTDKSGVSSKLRSTNNNSVRIKDLGLNVVKKEIDDLNECKECNSGFYYGKEIDINVNFFEKATRLDYSDDEYVWVLEFKSEEAKGYQFIFDKFYLPEGAKLFIYNADRSMLLGAFTSANNRKDLTFLTQHINGNDVFIEYVQPKETKTLDQISVEKVVYIVSDNFDKRTSLECQINTSCSEANGLDIEIKSTVMIMKPLILAKNRYWAFCTGTLINDGDNYKNNKNAYLLSANHCYEDFNNEDPSQKNNEDVSQFIFIFRYEATYCQSDGSEVLRNLSKSALGAEILARDNGSKVNDFLLLKLDNTVDEIAKFDVICAGYDLNERPAAIGGENDPLINVSHPSGDVKKIMIGWQKAKSTGLIFKPNGNLGFDDKRDDYLVVYPTIGVGAEGGSSGSALFDSNGLVIGTLSGGYKYITCELDRKITSNYFGKLSRAPIADSSIRNYLLSDQADAYIPGLGSYNSNCRKIKIINSANDPLLSIKSSDEKEIGAGYINIQNVTLGGGDRNAKYAVEAYESIILGTGTVISSGTTFSAKIVPCPAVTRAIEVRSADLDTQTNAQEKYLASENKVIIYPNPTDGIVSIQTENGLKVYRVDVYDMNGRLVIKSSDIVNPYAFYLNNIANGVYLLKIYTDAGVSSHKIIKK